MFKEFKAFVSRGNVVDLAVGVIMGGAFGKVVSSLVADIIMPPIGLVLGRVNFTDLKLDLGDWVHSPQPVTINYGTFLQTTLDFLIVSVAVFLLVQAIHRLRSRQASAPADEKPAPGPEEVLLREIRDLLRTQTARTSSAAGGPSPAGGESASPPP
jgi:large conductance mechanosensitive channel